VIRSTLLLLAWCALATPARAQELQQLTPGARVRVTLIAPGPVNVGRFEAVNDSALLLSGTPAIPLQNIRRLEVSGGRQRNLVTGIAGLILGIAVGGVLGCAANRDSYGVFCAGQDDTRVALGAAIGGVTGAAAGAFLFRRERWTPIDIGGAR